MISSREVQDNFSAMLKVAASWFLSLQMQDIAILLSIAYTAVQLFILIRKEFFQKRRSKRKDDVEDSV
jgi:hypothetical protein